MPMPPEPVIGGSGWGNTLNNWMTAANNILNNMSASGNNLSTVGNLTVGGTLSANGTVSNPKINSIYDTNANLSLLISAVTNAVNYLQLNDAATGTPVQLLAQGSDSNVGLQVATKGSGVLGIQQKSNTRFDPVVTAAAGNATSDGSLSAGIASFNNPGTAGGAMNYVNIGGLKLLWGVTAGFTVPAASNSNWQTVTFPSGFFQTVMGDGMVAGIGNSGSITANTQNGTTSASGFTLVINNANNASSSCWARYIAIGT